ncbi:hypothetical protein JY651_22915 [Pyxidicoccus parkwayensis]|uniref:Uncharacterized protein n=1 Tax=Pyxidicoccus parkwayensis TaxID=2813578 RepID=A0ABX7PAQ6_9BACT|nr:hypothetical protein [Pyxidicoccus parkwaysis]QSQ27589.1 hypothetical protein JY651_22915 [Pyxidicoccus parkwaysis]
MSTFPRSPRTQRGAIIGLDPMNPVSSVVVFQYNPDTMTRTLQPQMAGDNGDRTEVQRLKGPPIETIKLDVEIDATDQLAAVNPIATSMGIYPQLSALEMLVYPKTAQVLLNNVLAKAGVLEVLPNVASMTLFVWGPKRVVPVKLTEFSITEEAYDPSLNPIRAKVTLSLRVLTYNDLSITHPGFALFFSHQVVKEAMAVVGSVSGAASALPR